ncbi:MAG: hypothetical protein E6R13_05140 [Spirochaetes bacterium]|nr:MAG: hypothetical protein E6R13_05140 [Spirochaetota bacterium]
MKEFFTKLTDGTYIPVDKMLHFTTQFMILAWLVTAFLLLEWECDFRIFQGFNFALATGKGLFDRFVKQTYFDEGDMTAGILGGTLAIILTSQW